MATRDALFPKKWFQASDLPPSGLVVRIAKVEPERIGVEQELKTIVYFKGQEKRLVLNVTKFDAIVAVTGEADTEAWTNKIIALFPGKTRMGGKVVDCIEVRAATPKGGPTHAVKAPPVAPVQEQEPPPYEPDNSVERLDDAVPF
jgi:hypothetical protein